MIVGMTVELDEDGIFSCSGPAGDFVLFFSGDKGEERWLLTRAADDEGGVPPLLAWQLDLDEGLRLLVATAGSVDPFKVVLPSGESFGRPGKVPALEVMAALGYSVVRGVNAFVVLSDSAEVGADVLRRELLWRLRDRAVEVGALEMVEGDGESSVWCCDLKIEFEGPIRENSARGLVSRMLADSGLEVMEQVELDLLYKVPPNTAAVVRFVRPATAA